MAEEEKRRQQQKGGGVRVSRSSSRHGTPLPDNTPNNTNNTMLDNNSPATQHNSGGHNNSAANNTGPAHRYAQRGTSPDVRRRGIYSKNPATSRLQEPNHAAVEVTSPTTMTRPSPACDEASAYEDLVWSDLSLSLRDFVTAHRLPAMARVVSRPGDNSLDCLPAPPSLPPSYTSQQHQQNQQEQQQKPQHQNQQQQHQQGGPMGSSGPVSGVSPEVVVRIYEVGKRRVVLARRVHWEKRQHDYVVSGDQLVIPSPFRGWFEAVPEDGRPVAYCDTVTSLVADKPRQFLVRTPTVAYRRSLQDQGNSCWMPHEVPAGQVLTTGVVYDQLPSINNTTTTSSTATTSTSTSNANTRASRATTEGSSKKNKRSRSTSPGRGLLRRLLKPSRRQQKEQEYKYLQCWDSGGEELAVPLATSGVFSPVGLPSMASFHAVYQLHDLVLAFGFPVNAQLIHSGPQERKLCPQGVLRLYGTREEEMAVISRLQLPPNNSSNSSINHNNNDDGKAGSGVSTAVVASAVESEKVEVSLDRNLQLQPKKRKSPTAGGRTSSDVSSPGRTGIGTELSSQSKVSSTSTEDASQGHSQGQGEQKPAGSSPKLPQYVSKELKKFKSTGILDKLSVRAMRREQAKARENGSSSRQVPQHAQHDLCYQDFHKGLQTQAQGKGQGADNALTTTTTTTQPTPAAEKTLPQGNFPRESPNHSSSGSSNTTTATSATSSTRSSEARRLSLQTRDLPPLPRRTPVTPSLHGDSGSGKGSKDSLYEHLPPAPSPPSSAHRRSCSEPVRNERDTKKDFTPAQDTNSQHAAPSAESNGHDHYNNGYDDDGYMVPSDFPGLDSVYSINGHVQMRSRPPGQLWGDPHQDHLQGHQGLKAARLKKCHSELFPSELHTGPHLTPDDDCPLDIDQLFSATYSKKQAVYGTGPWTGSSSQLYDLHSRKAAQAQAQASVSAWRDDVERHNDTLHHHPNPHSHPHTTTTTTTATTAPPYYLLHPSATGSLDRRQRKSVERLDLETCGPGGRRAKRSPSHSHTGSGAHATIRSHNLRQPRASLMELFHFGDSFRDVEANDHTTAATCSDPLETAGVGGGGEGGGSQVITTTTSTSSSSAGPLQGLTPQSPFPSMSIARIGERRRTSYGGEVLSAPLETLLHQDNYGSCARHAVYAESEPLFSPGGTYPNNHHHHHGPAFSDSAYPAQGDDSAISVGSRGERDMYGFPGDGCQHYSYADGSSSGGTVTSGEGWWTPPDDICGLSVHEVSLALRYIGMKDRVVLRFANEQIDGSMLASLDKRHLKEGFPELNALEVKKVLDFVHGWRPKKR